ASLNHFPRALRQPCVVGSSEVDRGRAIEVRKMSIVPPEAEDRKLGTARFQHAHASADSRVGEVMNEIRNPQSRSPRRDLVGTFAHNYCRNGCDDDPDIEPRTMRFHEQAIHRDTRAIRDVIAAADLPEPGDPRLHRTVMTEPTPVAGDLRFDDRTRADD